MCLCVHILTLGCEIISTDARDHKVFMNRLRDPSRKFKCIFRKNFVWTPEIGWKSLKWSLSQKFRHWFCVPVCAHTCFAVWYTQYRRSRPQTICESLRGLIAQVLALFLRSFCFCPWKPLKKPFLQKFLHRNCVPVCAHTYFGARHDQHRYSRPQSVCESLGGPIAQV